MTGFGCVLVDFPWKFNDNLPTGGGANHFKCLTVEEGMNFELPPLADDVLMGFWRVAAMQKEAFRILDAWGFEVKSEIVWDKITKHGKPHFGMGYYTRGAHEVCLIARRGKPKILDHSIRSRFAAPVGRHSQKPDEIFSIFERLCAGPRVELFSRRHRDGWTCFGDELEANNEQK